MPRTQNPVPKTKYQVPRLQYLAFRVLSLSFYFYLLSFVFCLLSFLIIILATQTHNMALNYIWIAFFIIGFLVALGQLIFSGNTQIFNELVNSVFLNAKTGFEISLGLTGALTLWMGLLKVGEKGGVVAILGRLIGPLFQKLFPGLPKGHPAYGSIMLNISANMLGLDNAATPVGLKAMKEMHEVNPDKETASNAQIMFLVLNAAGLTIIPVSIIVYRTQLGAVNPADIFIPILISTFAASLTGMVSVAIIQKINLFDKVIVLFIVLAFIKKINVYDAFIEGAKEGFNIAIKIIPFLVAILVAIGIFRASGAMDFIITGIATFFAWLGVDTQFTGALPVAFMKPLSGSGARGLMIDAMTTYGADSFIGRLACTMQGTTDTTFYIVAVYFGSVGIKNTKYSIGCGLLADLAGFTAAIFVAYLFFT